MHRGLLGDDGANADDALPAVDPVRPVLPCRICGEHANQPPDAAAEPLPALLGRGVGHHIRHHCLPDGVDGHPRLLARGRRGGGRQAALLPLAQARVVVLLLCLVLRLQRQVQLPRKVPLVPGGLHVLPDLCPRRRRELQGQARVPPHPQQHRRGCRQHRWGDPQGLHHLHPLRHRDHRPAQLPERGLLPLLWVLGRLCEAHALGQVRRGGHPLQEDPADAGGVDQVQRLQEGPGRGAQRGGGEVRDERRDGGEGRLPAGAGRGDDPLDTRRLPDQDGVAADAHERRPHQGAERGGVAEGDQGQQGPLPEVAVQ
mmetsp:Transcript_13803/g.34686  ORF Transcript_13803/g.34686 Transcript_13803/m.34686 type:complete len:314 (+) Transcript_13803:449-1390(+)